MRVSFGDVNGSMTDRQDTEREIREVLKEHLEQIRFARAAELARSKRYLDAEGVLAPGGRVSSNPRELDLLARISAHQRRYGRARWLWEAALRESPDNTRFERAIEATKAAEHFQTIFRRGVLIALLLIAFATSLVAVWSFFRHRPSTPKVGSVQRSEERTKQTPQSPASPIAAQASQPQQRPTPSVPASVTSPVAVSSLSAAPETLSSVPAPQPEAVASPSPTLEAPSPEPTQQADALASPFSTPETPSTASTPPPPRDSPDKP